jgi:NitT/TauT family transport system ATP-binding protein
MAPEGPRARAAGGDVLEFVGVSKVFRMPSGRAEYVLKGVSFSQATCSLCCVLGPSGSGKTTLLNLVAGFLRPTDGRVLVDGREVRSPGPDRAMVFQDYGLLPWLTVRGNVELGLRFQRVPAGERRTRVGHYVSLVGLHESIDKLPHQLSGGMQQRVSIARALALEPLMLLMDEPFGGLDAQTRLVMQSELIRIWSETQKTVLFVTHSVDEAIYLADRIVVVGGRPGGIIKHIDVRLERPRDRTSADFNDIKRDVHEVLGVPV